MLTYCVYAAASVLEDLTILIQTSKNENTGNLAGKKIHFYVLCQIIIMQDKLI